MRLRDRLDERIDPFDAVDIAAAFSDDPELERVADRVWDSASELHRAVKHFVPAKHRKEFDAAFAKAYGSISESLRTVSDLRGLADDQGSAWVMVGRGHTLVCVSADDMDEAGDRSRTVWGTDKDGGEVEVDIPNAAPYGGRVAEALAQDWQMAVLAAANSALKFMGSNLKAREFERSTKEDRLFVELFMPAAADPALGWSVKVGTEMLDKRSLGKLTKGLESAMANGPHAGRYQVHGQSGVLVVYRLG